MFAFRKVVLGTVGDNVTVVCKTCGGSGASKRFFEILDQLSIEPQKPIPTPKSAWTANHAPIISLVMNQLERSLGKLIPDMVPVSIEGLTERVYVHQLVHKDSAAVKHLAAIAAARFNLSEIHHLTQGDVDALVKCGKLKEFTHFLKEGQWVPKNDVNVSALAVNAWSLVGMGHDTISRNIVAKHRASLEGLKPNDCKCQACNGDGVEAISVETFQKGAYKLEEGNVMCEYFQVMEYVPGTGWLANTSLTQGKSNFFTQLLTNDKFKDLTLGFIHKAIESGESFN